MEKVIKELINYLISHSEVKNCSFCEYQVNNRSMCNTCNKNLRSNFKPDTATELVYRYRAEGIINIINECGIELFLSENKFKFKVRDEVLVRSSENSEWHYSIFSHYSNNKAFPYVICSGNLHSYCIPFKGNEHLLGTKNNN